MVKNLLEVIQFLKGLQQAKHLRMMNVFRLQSTEIGDWQVRTRSWSGDSKKLLCPRFWRRILAWNMLWQNLFRGFCYQSRRNIVLQLLMAWFKPLPMSQISSRMSQTEMNRAGLQLHIWSGNKGPVAPVEATWFSTPKEGAAKSQQNQVHGICVFDWEGVVHHEYAPPGQTVRKDN